MKTNTKHWASITAGILSLAGYASALGSEKYTYDASGNVVEKKIDDQVTRFIFEGNTLQASNLGATYLHDHAGRLLGEVRDGRVERKLTYQFGDKVTRVEKNDGGAADFLYNAEGQLVGKKINGIAEAFAWDGLGLVMRGEHNYANEEHLVGSVPTLIGNEVVVSDTIGSSLSVGEECFKSTAFGEGLECGLFTGKPFVKELESFVFNQRNYSAAGIRWITGDPTGYPDGENNYLYVNGDPMTRFDAYGLEQATITSHWSKIVGGITYTGDATTLFNYTFEADSNGKSRMKTHAVVGAAGYTGDTGYIEYVNSNTADIDTNADGLPDTWGSKKFQYGVYGADHKDTSAEWAESKVEGAKTYKRDRASAELWINQPLASSNGYFVGTNYTVVTGPDTSTSKLDLQKKEFFGDWVEQ